ncbi:MAG: pesticidal protein Cry7Aa [Parabacteroides sp.]|nr:pesticidal protein Cry7Aa [Parabacteroides sp.]
MITVKREGVILEPTHLTFKNESIMNPAVIAEGNTVHLFYRATQEGNRSTIGYCRLEGPLKVVHHNKEPLLRPEFDYESQGVEDPRIVKIDDLYYMTYTAYDGDSAMGALAVSKDLKHFEKKGVVTSQFTYPQFVELLKEDDHPHTAKYYRSYNNREATTRDGKPLYLTDKNLVFFARRINGKLFFMHRIKPDIQWVAVDTMEELTAEFWTDYYSDFTRYIFFEPHFAHESSYIGAGCPPIELDEGWLMIYHSVRDTPEGYIYSASAALLDRDDPTIEIARLPYPLFAPETDYETKGVVNQVCFPTGAIIREDRLYIYYGAADTSIACASVSVKELINELLSYKKRRDEK